MEAAFYLLLVVGHLGVFDVFYFHKYRCALERRAECQREVLWHTLRHLIYASQFLVVAHLRFHGAALLLLVLLFAADVFIAWADVWSETESRKGLGGLPRGEYFMHVVLSVLVGAYLVSVIQSAWPDRELETAIVYAPPAVPLFWRGYMTFMAAGALAAFAFDLRQWLRVRRLGPGAAARKIVVEALVPAPLPRVWERTQDPEAHVAWDVRFDEIRYLEVSDARGFRPLLYRTRIGLGVSVAGTGRYLQTVPLQHSTFEFDSDDWKSLIQHGRGVWMYEARGEGTYFKTVYDYEIRHGFVGYLLDLLFFRRLLQLATEWGFDTLRRTCASEDAALLRRRRSRWRFGIFFLLRTLGVPPARGAARSWLGSGQAKESAPAWAA